MRYIIAMNQVRPLTLADALFGKTKKAVIGILFARPEKSWHLRELARRAGVSPTMLGKEADALSAAGILLDKRDGNRRTLAANPACPIFDELRGIARKTSGLADVLRHAIAELAGIDSAFIFGSVARGEETPGSDVDLCLVGKASYRALTAALAGAEDSVGRPINPVLYSVEELRQKWREGSAFVTGMLSSDRIFLIGDDDALARTIVESVESAVGAVAAQSAHANDRRNKAAHRKSRQLAHGRET